jgi:phospholipase C
MLMGDPIRHVVVLLLENRSFDQMFGCFSEVYPDLDGIDRLHPHVNRLPPESASGRQEIFAQRPTTLRQMPWRKPYLWDPHHEVSHVRVQLEGTNDHPEQMGGFVSDFVQAYPTSTDEARQYVMDYFPLGFLPALHALGRDFTICDRWFSSLPGPTWPNRFFALSGTASGRVDMPGDGTNHIDVPGYFHQRQATLFDRLNEKGIYWKSYFHDIPQSWVLRRPRLPHNVARYFYIDEFFDDARGQADDFPLFCYIEPDFLGFQQNDDHPPHDVMKGEKLVADVYNALRGNTELWHSTLLVIFFDEHGGFYDHVYPPAAVPPDPPGQHKHQIISEMLARLNPWHKPAETYSFDQLGVRVPALLVSPWVRRGVAKVGVESPLFDHTSLLKYLTDKWDLGPLGLRTAQARSIGILIEDSIRPDDDTVGRIVMPPFAPIDSELEDAAFGISEHDKSLQKLAIFLKTNLWLQPKSAATELIVESVPQFFVFFEGLMFLLSWRARGLGNWLFKWDRRPRASFGEPDKIHTDTASPRDDVAWFLMKRKGQALYAIDREMKLAGARRDHAIRTLAMITGRPFHRQEPAHAEQWLATHKHF